MIIKIVIFSYHIWHDGSSIRYQFTVQISVGSVKMLIFEEDPVLHLATFSSQGLTFCENSFFNFILKIYIKLEAGEGIQVTCG